MSEHTPESTASLSDDDAFGAADSEPSMEDILASIRKIIADDADPVPLDGPGQDSPQAELPSVAPVETVSPETVSSDPDELDLEALLGGLDMDAGGMDTSDTVSEPLTLEDQIDEAFTLAEESEADLEAALSMPATDMAQPDVEMPLTLDTPIDVDSDAVPDEMDSIMNELMGGIELATDATASVADIVTPEPEFAPRVEATSDEDLDLVKSLMADLTDEDEAPSDTADEDLDALEDNILDSIMDMALTHETDRFDADSDDGPDLSDIAAAAEADAGLAIAPQPEPQPVMADAPQPDPSELETPMPSAQRSDAILDNVTEAATKNAFAELNQVVEDKAVLSERGPRIGDLVQDALRPMLKEWLDENLQAIVERAVAKEVKRIADGK